MKHLQSIIQQVLDLEIELPSDPEITGEITGIITSLYHIDFLLREGSCAENSHSRLTR